MPVPMYHAICSRALLLCLAAVPVNVRCQTPAPDDKPDAVVERELTEARLLYNHAEYRLAEKLYAQILAFDPGNSRAIRGRDLLIRTWNSPTKPPAGHPFAVGPDYPSKPTPYNAVVEPWEAKTPVEVAALKSSKVIMPRLSFDGVTLSEAVETIRRESPRLDTDPRIEARGVAIFLRPSSPLGEYEVAAEVPAQTDEKIFLRLQNATLDEALEFVCRQVGLRTSYHEDGITLVQDRGKLGEELRLATFRPWPELAAALNDAVEPKDFSGAHIISGGIRFPRADAVRFLESKGIAFPPGASAVYHPQRSGGQIFVANTPENLEKMEKLVEQSENGPVLSPTPDHP